MSSTLARGNVTKMYLLSVTYDPANITGTATTTEQDITVVGVKVGDFVMVNKPSSTAGVTIGNARVKAADTVSIQWVNPTAGAVNPASEAYLICILRPENPPPAAMP